MSIGHLLSTLVCFTVLLLPFDSMASEEEEFDAVHHTADAYYLDFLPFAKVELPRLFIVRHELSGTQLLAYSSTKRALQSGEMLPYPDHASDEPHDDEPHTASPVDLDALITSGKHLDSKLIPREGALLLDLSITKHLVFSILASGILLTIFIRLARRYRRGIGRTSAPKGVFQNLFETLIVFVRADIAVPNLGKENSDRFLPYLLTAFFFILTCNLLGLVPFGATATSNLNITAVLAGFTFVLTQFNGSKDHWKHVFWPPDMPVLVKFLLIPTEIMGLFTKPIALAIRLFANLTAGHLVILSLIGMIFTFTQLFGEVVGYGVVPISLGFTLFVMFLEILIAFIQAYIFTILSALFIGMAIASHSHSEAH